MSTDLGELVSLVVHPAVPFRGDARGLHVVDLLVLDPAVLAERVLQVLEVLVAIAVDAHQRAKLDLTVLRPTVRFCPSATRYPAPQCHSVRSHADRWKRQGSYQSEYTNPLGPHRVHLDERLPPPEGLERLHVLLDHGRHG